MSYIFRKSYQYEDGLQQAIVDLVRVGSGGYAPGVRQVANRLMKAVPPGIADAASFRLAIHEALDDKVASPTLDQFALPKIVDSDGAYALAELDYPTDCDSLILNEETFQPLQEIVRERNNALLLRREGVGLTRSVLLSGPPGLGKTMAAGWLASSIGVPLLTLNLSAVVSRFLGNSGRNIKSVLDFARSGHCVLLLDEFDALAKRRDDDTDIGELKRIVNVVLMELDRWPDMSLLVAATNHEQLLDPAVHRRFDRHIRFVLPSHYERRKILNNLVGAALEIDESILETVALTTEGVSGSDLERLWKIARRRALMNSTETGIELCIGVLEICSRAGKPREDLWLLLHDRANMSLRQIATQSGVSHPTVSAAIKRSRGRV